MIDVSKIAEKCVVGPDGIWYAGPPGEISYPTQANNACAQIEDSSFWFKHRNNCITAAVQSYPPTTGEAIFDIGGGNGFVSLGLLKAGFNAVVVEPGISGAMNARNRGVPTVLCATTTTAGFVEGSLGAIGVFDVVEHIENDLSFLRSLRALLKADGKIYVTVPAYQILWSNEDITAGHFRRYTSRSIRRTLEEAGFLVDYATYFFRPLPLPILAMRALPYRLGLKRNKKTTSTKAHEAHMTRHTLVNRALLSVLSSEVASIKSNKPMSFGGSCLVVARNAC